MTIQIPLHIFETLHPIIARQSGFASIKLQTRSLLGLDLVATGNLNKGQWFARQLLALQALSSEDLQGVISNHNYPAELLKFKSNPLMGFLNLAPEQQTTSFILWKRSLKNEETTAFGFCA